jgi:hypothetical protein
VSSAPSTVQSVVSTATNIKPPPLPGVGG